MAEVPPAIVVTDAETAAGGGFPLKFPHLLTPVTQAPPNPAPVRALNRPQTCMNHVAAGSNALLKITNSTAVHR
jgi:hypothetical protein